MKESFDKAAKKAEAEQFLTNENIPYEKRADGTLHVKQSISLINRDLKKLPDLSCVVLEGDFLCYDNKLTSLAGAPQSVRYCMCSDNKLTSLEGAPQNFKMLQSDFGAFQSYNDIPEKLHFSPEVWAKREKEIADAEEERIKLVSDPQLRRALPVRPPLQFGN